MSNLTGVALVTGAGRGIGRAVSQRLAAEGMAVGLFARTAEQVESAVAEIEAAGGRAICAAGDVTDRAAVEAFVARVAAELGPVDLLVNNAAQSASWNWEKFWEVDPDDWWSRVATNLRGPALFAHAVLPSMVERGTGRVVQMNSLAGAGALPMTDGAYPVSKAALFRLTDQIASQLGDTGVVVLDLSPGLVKTQANDNPAIPEHMWTPIDRICDLVVRVAHGELDALTGRFVHAEDDLDRMVAEAAEVVERDGRAMRMRPAWESDAKVPVPKG